MDRRTASLLCGFQLCNYIYCGGYTVIFHVLQEEADFTYLTYHCLSTLGKWWQKEVFSCTYNWRWKKIGSCHVVANAGMDLKTMHKKRLIAPKVGCKEYHPEYVDVWSHWKRSICMTLIGLNPELRLTYPFLFRQSFAISKIFAPSDNSTRIVYIRLKAAEKQYAFAASSQKWAGSSPTCVLYSFYPMSAALII